VSTFFLADIYRGRHFFGPNELKLSPLSKLGYAIFFQVKTTTHFIRLTPIKLFIGCFFFFVQLNNYISNLSLLKYFIQKIYGKRDISQQVVTLSKFGNARIYGIILLFNTTEIKYTLFPKLIYPENV
jgi:hypothetical protein